MPNMNNNYLSDENRQALIKWLAVHLKDVVEERGLTQVQTAKEMTKALGFKVTIGNIASAIKMLNTPWPSKSNLNALARARAARKERRTPAERFHHRAQTGQSDAAQTQEATPPMPEWVRAEKASGSNDPYEIVKSACISLDAIAEMMEGSRDGKMLVMSMAMQGIISSLEHAKKLLT